MTTAKVVLEIPAEVLDAVKFPPGEVEGELRKELALALYQRQALGIGPARLLAGMTRWEFEELLGQRQIQRHYTAQDLDEDIAFSARSQGAGGRWQGAGGREQVAGGR